jgi:hypothetical protein
MWSPDVRRLNKRTWQEEPLDIDSPVRDDSKIEEWTWQDVDKFRAVLKAAEVPVAHIEALVYFINLKRSSSRAATPPPCARDAITVELSLAAGSVGGQVRLQLWVYDAAVADSTPTPAGVLDVVVGRGGTTAVMVPDPKAARLVQWYYSGVYGVTVDEKASELSGGTLGGLQLGAQLAMAVSDDFSWRDLDDEVGAVR